MVSIDSKSKQSLVMSMRNKIKKLAFSQGAQLVAMASVEAYADYLAEIEKRYQDTGAHLEDFMISPVENMPSSQDMPFFTCLSDPRKLYPRQGPSSYSVSMLTTKRRSTRIHVKSYEGKQQEFITTIQWFAKLLSAWPVLLKRMDTQSSRVNIFR